MRARIMYGNEAKQDGLRLALYTESRKLFGKTVRVSFDATDTWLMPVTELAGNGLHICETGTKNWYVSLQKYKSLSDRIGYYNLVPDGEGYLLEKI